MAARIVKADVSPPDRERIEARYAAEGLRPYAWGNAPGDRYDWHAHGYTKVLYCVTGSIVFHTRDGDLALEPGDRLEVDPGTEHAATVGGEGVLCLEAAA
ncbi:MAG: cupin domain-containing protein [Solirubrobacteraceae bacterium]|nr:cupin domain-containing protein [Solirubrobacteraceae bacterium]